MKSMTRNVPMRRGARIQRGATLLEAIAYLGIAAIIIVGAVSLLTRAFSAASSTQTIEQFEAIHVNVKKLYASQPNYTSLANNVLYNAGGFPTTLRISGGGAVIQNSWGGQVTVAPFGAAANTFSISFQNLPADVCMEVLSSFTDNHWSSVASSIGNFTAGGPGALPVAPSAAVPACAGGGATITATSLN